MPDIFIDDPADPRLGDFIGLRDRELRTRGNQSNSEVGLFVAEGDTVVSRALRAGYELSSILVDATRPTPLPFAVADGVTTIRCGREVIERITGLAVHRGSLGLFERREEPTVSEVLANASRAVVLEAVVNPVNLGVMARSAIGLGMDSLFLDPACVDPLYRRCSRVAMGEIFDLPTAQIPALPEGVDELKKNGFTVLALSPARDSVAIDELDFSPTDKVALMLGSEGPGLSDRAIGASDMTVRIPLSGRVDSLNVGAAATIAFYLLGAKPL